MTFFLAEDVILLLAFAFAADFDVDFDSEKDAFFAAAVVLLADDTAFFAELTLDAVLLDESKAPVMAPIAPPIIVLAVALSLLEVFFMLFFELDELVVFFLVVVEVFFVLVFLLLDVLLDDVELLELEELLALSAVYLADCLNVSCTLQLVITPLGAICVSVMFASVSMSSKGISFIPPR